MELVKVSTTRHKRDFLALPLKMYKDCPFFVPPLYSDEAKIFKKNYIYNDDCLSEFFLVYDNDKAVGRIQGIIQTASNKKTGERRARFSRFDAINDVEVAKLLFSAVEDWAKSQGMDTVCGPLSYSDLEREGMLIEGFDQLSTFEEQYNYYYYPELLEAVGYTKEVDWYEYNVKAPDVIPEKVKKVSDIVLQRYNYHIPEGKDKRKFIDKYKEGIFRCLDEGYKDLYGTVPFTAKMEKQLIDQFMLIVNIKYLIVVCDEEENVVAFGLAFPGIGEALVGSSGRLTPLRLFKLLRVIKKPKVIDLGLISVRPEHRFKGINAVMMYRMMLACDTLKIDHYETNLCLEYNSAIQKQWKYFNATCHKRRRSYKKEITE